MVYAPIRIKLQARNVAAKMGVTHMKRITISVITSMLVVSSAFGCRVEYINDTNNTFFAFDENHNEGHMVAPGEQHAYGEKGRHPVVTFYTQLPDGSFKKSYRIIQNACAMNEADKILPLTAAINGSINMDIYSVTNFDLNPEKPACCMHDGDGQAKAAVDQPLTSMDEE